jgi:adenylosuccinate lyase
LLENMDRVRGMVYSQTVLLALVRAGASREDAYAAVQRCAMRVWDQDADFRETLARDPAVAALLPAAELDRCFDPAWHRRHVGQLFARTLDQA